MYRTVRGRPLAFDEFRLAEASGKRRKGSRVENLRKLTAGERAALEKMAGRLPMDAGCQLLKDVDVCSVAAQTADGSLIRFDLPAYPRPTCAGQHAYAIEGVVTNLDQAEITVCIYADVKDRLLELELIKWEDTPILGPDWGTFRVAW